MTKSQTVCDACGRDITRVSHDVRQGYRIALINQQVEADPTWFPDTSGPWLNHDRHFCDPICLRVWMEKELKKCKVEAK
jgi:hypothetical protein